MFVAIDGELVAPEAATISVFDRGFLYGDSVFDTTRTYGGVAFRLREHVERLAGSAAKMGFELPLGVEPLTAEVQRLIDQLRPQAGGVELVARLMVTRGQGPFGLDPSGAHDARRVLYLHGLSRPPAGAYEQGVEVISYSTFRPSDAALGAKVGNYLESVLALKHAKARGAHEALILTYDGHLVEGTTTNVFALHGARLITPPTSETLLPGITRGLVLQVAPELGFTVEERRMTPSDLASADEAFLTSSIRELLAISKIDGYAIGRGPPYEATRRLHLAVRERFGMVGPPPWE